MVKNLIPLETPGKQLYKVTGLGEICPKNISTKRKLIYRGYLLKINL